MTRTMMIGAGAVAVLAVAALAWMPWSDGGPLTPADPTDTALVAQGAEIYAARCASCHGADLEGEADWRQRKPSGALPAPPHDAGGHTWHHPDQQLFAITKQGLGPFAPEGYVTDMPAFGDVLSDQEIWAVLAFIKSQWPKDIREAQAKRTQAAAAGG